MARGGRFIYKKSNIGRRRLKNDDEADDDGDEEYVLGEDDEVEESEGEYESDVNSRDLSGEESFEFSESDDEIARSKKTTKKRSYKKSRVSRVSDDDDDEIEDLWMPKKRGRGKPRKNESRDSDFELDDDDEDDDDDDEFLPDEEDFDEDEVSMVSKRRGGKNGGKKRRSKVSKTKGRKKGRAVASPARKRRRRSIESDDEADDDDFVVKDRVSVGRKRSNSKKARRKRSPVHSDYLDSDFVISDDDFVEKGRVAFNNRRKNSKKTKKKTPASAGSKGRRKKRSVEGSEASDSDFVVSDADLLLDDDDDVEEEDFIVREEVVVDKQQKKNKKEKAVGSNKRSGKRSLVATESSDSDYLVSEDDDEFALEDLVVVDELVAGSNKRKRRKRPSVVSESSDSEYLVSEDGDESVAKDDILVDKRQNKSKKARKRSIEPKTTRRRLNSVVLSDCESFDFDDMISEEEVRDLRIGRGLILNEEQPKRILTLRKGEVKGKEKQADDSGKQVCGICLSEEKKSVIQGLLNCCSHYFCFACIMEWSRVESRCPLCKRRFETITKSGSDPGFGMRGAVIRVQKRDQVYEPSEEELRGMLDPYENVVCMECQQGGDDNLMLLCDICDSSAHTYCVGLGREVPEGNWYCECCRSVNDGPSHSQFQDTMPDQEAINNSFPGVTERYGFTNVSANSPRPVSMTGRSSSLRIDLNALPRDFPGEDYCVPSPISGSAASTVLGRRHIRQRIHVILTTNRQRHTPGGTNMLPPNSGADVAHNGEASHASENPSPLPSVSGFAQWQQNPRPFFRSHTNLAPCTFSEGSSLRHVDGAKEEVQRMVKSHLKNLSQNRVLDRSTFKEIAKNSTHSILAACGIEHRRSMVSAGVEPPDNCTHDSDDGPAHLLKGCCSSCFSSFIKDVVQRLIGTAS